MQEWWWLADVFADSSVMRFNRNVSEQIIPINSLNLSVPLPKINLLTKLRAKSIFRLGERIKQVNIHDAKTHFSQLISKVSAGEEITISKAGKPVARLVPIIFRVARRIPGTAKGIITICDSFDEPLPDEVLREFEQ